MRGSSYSRIEQWLHWVALAPRPVRELSFDLERRFAAPRRSAPPGGAAYVCGLARSGTTVLLRALASCEAFRSLTYRDMPFVLAPNLWRRIADRAKRESPPVERAHGDGIMVDFDSPEAFEEVFWLTFCPQPADSKCYAPRAPDDETMKAFAQYRSIVAGDRRYLSKNNNNLVRLRPLAEQGGGTIIVVYRDPVEAARSLHRQHLRFGKAQAEMPFTRSYMSWLGHHEFGLDHKPFCFAISSMNEQLSPEQPDYWLAYWTAVHEHVDRQDLPLRLFDYDRACLDPAAALGAVLGALDVREEAGKVSSEIRAARGKPVAPDEFDAAIVARARATHASLQRSARNFQS